MPVAAWYGMNLFRLAAVTFTIWALAASFISLVDEVNTLSPSHVNTTSSTSSAGQTASITEWGIEGGMTVSGSQTADKPVLPAAPDVTSTKNIATSTFNALQRVSTTPTSGVIRPPPEEDEDDTGLSVVGLVGGMRRRDGQRWKNRRQNGAGETGYEEDKVALAEGVNAIEAVIGNDEPRIDRLAWVVISRLVIGVLLLGALGAQLGLPEMFLYDYVPWLGPQSTPLALGGLQTLCAIETLRSLGKTMNLIPAYALVAIGILNIIIGGLLLYLGRRLPKTPPPPLYFSHAQRLLFWKPEPPCYTQLFQPHLPSHNAESKRDAPTKSRTRRDKLPPSNAHAIGLEESSDEDDDKGGSIDAPRYVEGARSMTAEEDVLRGGYPTFAAGSGIGQPGRHVPAGTLEKDPWGGAIRLNQEEENLENTRRNPQARRNQPRRDSAFEAIQADLIDKARPPHTLPRPQAPVTRGKKGKVRSATLPDPPNLSRAPSNASDNSAYSGISRIKDLNYRKSIDQAAKDYGPHFPLPPSRANVQKENRSSPRNSRLDNLKPENISTKVGRRPPSAYLARGPLSPARTVNTPTSARMKAPPSRVSGLDSTVGSVMSPLPTLSLPHTPKTPIQTPSPVSAQIAKAQYGQVTAGHVLDRQLSARPEMLVEDESDAETAPDPPASAKARARSMTSETTVRNRPVQSSIKRATSVHAPARASRGVRFDLASVQEEAEPIPVPRSGLRIPGTNIHFSLPAILSPTPSRRNSVDSVASIAESEVLGSAGYRSRPVSEASITSMMKTMELDMKVDAKRSTRRQSSGAIMGGNYLVGGRETLK